MSCLAILLKEPLRGRDLGVLVRCEMHQKKINNDGPWLEETISWDTLDCLQDREEPRLLSVSLLLNIDAKKSSFVAPGN